MRLLSQFAYIFSLGTVKNTCNNDKDLTINRFSNDYPGRRRNMVILLSKVNDDDSFDDFFKEENYRNLPPEEQLKKMNEDKRVYNRLQRLVRRSREFELPENQIVSETIYPPPSTTTASSMTDDDGAIYNKNYEPIRTQHNSNTTLELITSIIQQPTSTSNTTTSSTAVGSGGSHFNLKTEKKFKIMDYSQVNDEPIHENEIYLDRINESLKKKNEPIIEPPGNDFIADTGIGTAASGGEGAPANYKPGGTSSRWELFEQLNRDERFVKELRGLKLNQAINYRRFLRHLRNLRKRSKMSYYHQLKENEKGYKIYTKDDIDRFSYEEMQEELRNRGYRCSYDQETLKCMLIDLLDNDEEEEWRYENIVKQDLSPDNLNLSQDSRNKLKELNEMVDVINSTGDSDDINIRIKRLQIIFELIDFYTDPVGYLSLDRNAQQLQEGEEERLRNAPVIYDTTFFNEMAKPIVRLPDLIPKTFNLQEDYVQKFPITTLQSKRELEDLKREYLTIQGGIHQQTLPEISHRFEVPLDFLGDSCCRLGAFAPIDLNRELRGIISYSGIWDLLQFLNICDGGEIDLFYSQHTLKQVSKELNVPMEKIYESLRELEIKPHFGDDTRLNLTCLQALEDYLKHGPDRE